MEIKFKGADFSANAVTKLSDGIDSTMNGCYLEDGSFSSANRYYKSTIVIPISQYMRNNGIIINNMAYMASGYPLVIFFNGEPSAATKISSINYNKGSLNIYKIYPKYIPSEATCFIVNFHKENNDGIVFENYFIPVVDNYEFVDGFVTATGSFNSDPQYHTTQMIPVSGSYWISGGILATYDKYGNFINRISDTPNILKKCTFEEDTAFIRLSNLKENITSIEY